MMTIDLMKLLKYMLKRIWLPILCAAIGFAAMYYYATYKVPDTYTASATMYVYNGNPNIINYQYTNASDLSTAVMLVDTYKVVVHSNKVMDAVVERLGAGFTPAYVSSTISIGSVSDTGVMKISCTTGDPELSMNICNAVADIAPAEILRVVSAGSVEVIDYADLPTLPNSHQSMRKGMTGGLAGGVIAVGFLFLLFMLNRKLTDSKELTDNYDVPLLAVIPKQHKKDFDEDYLIGDDTSSHVLASYGKLRMNLFFAMRDKTKILLVSSAIPGENKSTVSANLAISFALDGKRTLLIDGDMRKPTQTRLFGLDKKAGGLSDILVPQTGKEGKIWQAVRPNLDVLCAGTVPPNPSELMNSPEMRKLLKDFEQKYDVIILDTPPINVVSDALVLADTDVGLLFVARCGFSDHREIKRALKSVEMTDINLMGMVMTCATKTGDGYYGYRYYNKYYRRYYGAYDKKRGKTTD